jgi:hypothetical protein
MPAVAEALEGVRSGGAHEATKTLPARQPDYAADHPIH